MVFADQPVPQNLSSEIACTCKTTIQLQKFSSELKFSYAIVKLFYLKQFVAIYCNFAGQNDSYSI